MPSRIRRIDPSLPGPGTDAAAHDPPPDPRDFATALAGHAPPRQALPPPRPARPTVPQPVAPPAPPPPPFAPLPAALPHGAALPFVPPATIATVRAVLHVLSGLDRAATRRLLARFGGTLHAGQLAYALDTTPAIAAAAITLLDEVGDQRIGAEELDPATLAAAIQALDHP